VLTDPFDYAAEDALIDAWLAARRSVVLPSSRSRRDGASHTADPRAGRARTRSSPNERVSRAGPERPGRHGRERKQMSGERVSGAMDGVRILDMSIALTGPYAAALLADQGAAVIKLERPGIGDIARWVGRVGQRHELTLPRLQPGEAGDRGRHPDAGGRRHRAASRGGVRRCDPELPPRRDGQARARLRRHPCRERRRGVRVAGRASARRVRIATGVPTTR